MPSVRFQTSRFPKVNTVAYIAPLIENHIILSFFLHSYNDSIAVHNNNIY